MRFTPNKGDSFFLKEGRDSQSMDIKPPEGRDDNDEQQPSPR